MASVTLEHVKKVYPDGAAAVHEIDLQVKDKEFVVLVGPSGCGKSTTLRMIAGLEEVSSGKILIDGRVVNDVAPKDRDIAMVFQNYALYPHMTVFENMAFGLKLRKFPAKEIQKRVQEAAEVLGIENMLNRKPKALSGGQRQRVAVGRAIVRKPKVFLFDEPLSNLDAKLRVQMRTEISKLHKRLETTMIYVTHDQTEAMTMGDRIVVMKDGHVQQTDSALGLYEHPVNKFVAGFIGSPSMNFFAGEVKKSGNLVFIQKGGGFSLPIHPSAKRRLGKYVGKDVNLGIRPEHLRLRATGAGKWPSVKVKIEVVEPMGNEVFVYFKTEKSPDQYVARFSVSEPPPPGQWLNLYFDTSKAHFFDSTSERVI